MSEITIAILGFVALFGLIGLRVPIAFAMGIVGLIGFALTVSLPAALVKLSSISFETISSYNIGVLPLFILMAHVTFVSGMGQDLYNVAAKWLGHKRGGLAMATVGGCAGFAAVSASSIATASTMAAVSLPEMKKHNYDPSLATGSIAAGGTIGSLIPPSGMLIVLGLLTEMSITKLFLAGLIPGILEAIIYMLTIYILCVFRPNLGPRGKRHSWGERFASLSTTSEIIILLGIVLGGMALGWFTPTEAGAVGAFGAILIGFVRGKLTASLLKEALFDTLKTTGFIYAIFIGAIMMSAFITVTGLPDTISNSVLAMNVSPIVVILIILAIYLVLGAVLDVIGMITLTIPIFFPIALALGFDGIWFAIIVVRAMEMAMITPPIGMNAYIVAGVAKDVSIGTVFKGIIPFLIADIILIGLMIAFPEIITFLPKLMN